MATVRVRAIERDRPRAQAIIAALGAERIAATLATAPTAGSDPILFVYSKAAEKAKEFFDELKSQVASGTGIVVSYRTNTSLLDIAVPEGAQASLADWDGHDRSFSGFRDLVAACRRMLRSAQGLTALSIAQLSERRGRTVGRRGPLAPASAPDPAAKPRPPDAPGAKYTIPTSRPFPDYGRDLGDAGESRIGAGSAPPEGIGPGRRDSDLARILRQGSPDAPSDLQDLLKRYLGPEGLEPLSKGGRLPDIDGGYVPPSSREIGAAGEDHGERPTRIGSGAGRALDIGAGRALDIGAAREPWRAPAPPPARRQPEPPVVASAPPPRRAAPEPAAHPRQAPAKHRFWGHPVVRLAAVLAATSALIYWRHELAALAVAAMKVFTGATPPVPPAPNAADAKSDLVDVSAFAPAAGRAGDDVLIQIFLHLPEQAAAAAALAQMADADTTERGVTTLAVDIGRGQRIDIILEAPGLTIDEPAQFLIWRGEKRACQFIVSLPQDAAGRTCHMTVRAVVASVPVGVLKFGLKIAANTEAVPDRPDHRIPDVARRYERAFLSYASTDRMEVLKRAAMLKAAHISFFQDILDLEPGQRWEKRLYEEIDRCDLFLLFWSSNAAKSEWVIREAEYALGVKNKSVRETPDITPIILEGPPVPLPPESLRHIHFNDVLAYVIAGLKNESRAP